MLQASFVCLASFLFNAGCLHCRHVLFHDLEQCMLERFTVNVIAQMGERSRGVGREAASRHTFHATGRCVQVDREPMATRPPKEREADAANFPSVHPHALHAFVSVPLDLKDGQRFDDPPFDGVDDVRH